MKELFLDRGIVQSRAAVFENGQMVDLYIENHSDSSLTGNIYKGRIENIVPGLNAAFVNIGIGKNGILHFDESDEAIEFKRGKELLVQVTRESRGDKGPRLSSNISLPGKAIVLLPQASRSYISQKISGGETIKRLNDLYELMCKEKYGVIFRTESENTEDYEIIEEYNYLKRVWEMISSKISYIRPPQMVFNARDFFYFIIREFVKNDIDRIFISRRNDYEYLISLLASINPKKRDWIFYDEHNFRTSSIISSSIESLSSKRISLKSGGYIVIDRAEALTAIDVNTGSFTGSEDKEQTVFKTNMEACSEIYRIIKLWNISGIILIDFIDMRSEKSSEAVAAHFKDMFRGDRVPNKVYGFTNLGLLELSRAKKGKSFHELIYRNDNSNDYNISYHLKEMENNCLRLSKHYNKNEFEVYADSYILDEVKSNYSYFIDQMKELYNIKINITKSEGAKGYLFDKRQDNIDINILMQNTNIEGKILSVENLKNNEMIIKLKKVN